MRVKPGGTYLIFMCQILVIIVNIILTAMTRELETFAHNQGNIKWWEDDKGKAPFETNKSWTDSQKLFWNLGFVFLGVTVLTLSSFLHMFERSKYMDDIWGRSGAIFLVHMVFSWLCLVFGLSWIVYGIVGNKLICTSWIPDTTDGWSTPEITMFVMIAWMSISGAYTLVITFVYIRNRRRQTRGGMYRRYNESEEMDM